MKSMTGFGTSHYKQDELNIEVSIKSVNGRFFELRYHAPRVYFEFEPEIKKVLSKIIQRGTVDVYVQRDKKVVTKDIKVKTNKELAIKWSRAYKNLAKHAGLSQSLDMSTLLSGGEMISVETSAKASVVEKKIFLDILKDSLKKCDEQRQREGKALQSSLYQHLSELNKLVKGMNRLRNEANKKLQEKYQQRIGKLGISEVVDVDRITQEVAIKIDKADICEELTRITEHLRIFKKFIGQQKIQGKKLDFYSQELLREINTIGSKSQLFELTHLVVEAKTVVERIREQVQNIE